MLNEVLSSYIHSIEIENFRNHNFLLLESNAKFVLLLGDNGTGKTNILESISLFANGRGFRNAKAEDILKNDNRLHEWVTRIKYFSSKEYTEIMMAAKTIKNHHNMKKFLTINDVSQRQKKVAEMMKIIWLTPQMENFFHEPMSVQRRFIDRMTYNFFPSHAKMISEFEYFLKSRNKALLECGGDNNFLTCLERKIATLSVSIVENRQYCLTKINNCLEKLSLTQLQPKLLLTGWVENYLAKHTNNEVIMLLQEKLFSTRSIDTLTKRCSTGAHKSELEVLERVQGRKAVCCSTGEQKSMIIALIIGQSYALYEDTRIAPILLLDEVFSHLDNMGKRQLIFELSKTPAQIWITSTDKDLANMINDAKVFFSV